MERLIRQETLILSSFPQFSTKCEVAEDIDTQHALDTIVKELTEVLQMNVLHFLKNVTENGSYRAFMGSYLTHRSRPYATRASTKSPLQVRLLNLDKLILAVLFRLTSPIKEYHKIEQFVTKSKVSVFKGDSEQQTSIDTANLDQQYQQLLQAVPFLRAVRIMDMVAIIGHSNAHISSRLVQQLVEMRPVILEELTLAINEINTVVKELFVTCLPLAAKQSNKGGEDINVVYLSEFAADITVSLSLFVDAIPDQALLESKLFSTNTTCLSEQYGSNLFDIMQTIYEGIVPLLSSLPASLGEKGQHLLKITRLSCAKIFQRLVHVALTGNNGKAGRGNQHAEQLDEVAWFDVISRKLNLATLLPPNSTLNVNESLLAIGSFPMDYLSKMPEGKEEMAQLLMLSLGDRETVDMLIASIAPTAGSTSSSAAPFTTSPSMLSTASVAAQAPSVSSSQQHVVAATAGVSQEQLQEKISNIKSMFPDLGEAFIEACLRFYHMHDEEVIDALLSDNLHPKLRSLDRSAKAIWSGKHKTDLAMNFGSKIHVNNTNQKAPGGSAAETVDILAHRGNKSFVESQKDFIRRIEEKQRQDAQIINREYDDDYDDQMDDLISKKDTAFDDESPAIPQSQPQQKGSDWKQQMTDIRRYNTLLKEEEKEIAFWEGMRNTNHDTGKAGGSGSSKWKQRDHDDEDGEGKAARTTAIQSKAPYGNGAGMPRPQQVSQQPQDQQRDGEGGGRGRDQSGRGGQQGGRGGRRDTNKTDAQRSEAAKGKKETGDVEVSSSTSEDNKKKPRTKQFDKHHQRDKALRKLGPFG